PPRVFLEENAPDGMSEVKNNVQGERPRDGRTCTVARILPREADDELSCCIAPRDAREGLATAKHKDESSGPRMSPRPRATHQNSASGAAGCAQRERVSAQSALGSTARLSSGMARYWAVTTTSATRPAAAS